MTQRIYLHLAPDSLDTLNPGYPAGTEKGLSYSERATVVLRRYQAAATADCPSLTVAQWCAICEALNGTWLSDTHADQTGYLWAEVADCEGLGARWSVDQDELVALLKGAPAARLWAVADVVLRFWARASLGEDARAALLASGALLSEGS